MITLRDRTLRALLAGVLVAGCASESNNDAGNITNAGTLEASLQEWFMPTVNGVLDGFARLAVAAAGGAQDGVTITPDAGGYQGQVSVDFDGDGSRESTVQGRLDGMISSGAVVTISGLVSPGATGLAVTASADVSETSPTVLLFDAMQADFTVERPSTGNLGRATVTGGAVSVDLVSGTPVGFTDATVSETGQNLQVLLTFAATQGGGWNVTVTGNGVNFTVP